jgi:hypothetical protein
MIQSLQYSIKAALILIIILGGIMGAALSWATTADAAQAYGDILEGIQVQPVTNPPIYNCSGPQQAWCNQQSLNICGDPSGGCEQAATGQAFCFLSCAPMGVPPLIVPRNLPNSPRVRPGPVAPAIGNPVAVF